MRVSAICAQNLIRFIGGSAVISIDSGSGSSDNGFQCSVDLLSYAQCNGMAVDINSICRSPDDGALCHEMLFYCLGGADGRWVDSAVFGTTRKLSTPPHAPRGIFDCGDISAAVARL